jgi:hypothetical protein
MNDASILLNILLSVAGFLASLSFGVLCWFLKDIKSTLKDISDEMTELNLKLVEVVSNQEWHYSAIKELQGRVSALETKN